MNPKLSLSGNLAMFKDLIADVEENVKDEIYLTTSEIADQARQNVPVDTGFLKNSISDEVDDFKGEVRVSMHYAPYIEFGTGGLVDVPEGLEDHAIQFKGEGKRQVNIPPHPFLFPAFFSKTSEMLDRLKKQLWK